MKRDIKEIRSLFDKYLEGKTSLEEEEVLKAFLQSDEVPDDLISFRDEFLHYEEFGEIQAPEISYKNEEVRVIKPWWQEVVRYAAVFLIASISFSIGYFLKNDNNDLTSQVALLRTEIKTLKETTVQVLLESEESHQKIQAMVLATQLAEPSDQLMMQVARVYEVDSNPIVKNVALEFLISKKQTERIKNLLLASIISDDDPFIKMEAIRVLSEFNDAQVNDQLQKLLENSELDSIVRAEIEKINSSQNLKNL